MYNFYPENSGHVRSRNIARKFLLIMKLSSLLLVTMILHVSASSLAQKVTLVEKNAPLTEVFNHISNQTGYDFLFAGSDLKNAKPISIEIRNADLKEALDKLFQGQQLSYSIENKSVVVFVKGPSIFQQLIDKVKTAAGLPADIGGIVTDTLNNPLIGATISLKELHLITTTDSKGNFNFKNIPEGKYTLVASYVGYEKQETPIINNGKYLKLSFILHLSLSPLDQVRVIAYGIDSKRFSVGSVATVSAGQIEKQPVTNPLLALQGQVPGLTITSTSGLPGSQVLVQIRGQNTLNLNPTIFSTKPYDQPLFIVDGVPFAAQNNNVNQFASMVAAQSNSGGINPGQVGISPFNNIDPADIESISILKDADATSIYGTQGSNGVILITTKKGKAGPTSFNLNINTSFNSVGRPVDLLNAQQYLQYRRDAYAADGRTPGNSPNDFESYAPDLTIFDQAKYTNWQKVIYGNNTQNTDVHGSLSGGTVNNTFLISTGYNRSNFNYPGDFADQRFTLHSNIHHTSKDNRFLVDLISDFGYEQNNSAGYGGAQDVVLPPNLPDLKTPGGDLVWNYKGYDLTSSQFYSSLLEPTHLRNNNFNAALNASYKILGDLAFSINAGFNRNTTDENSIIPAAAQNPTGYINRQANFSTNNFQTLNIEPQLNYKHTFGKSALSMLLGSTYKQSTNKSTYTQGQGYANDAILGSINSAPTVSASDSYNIYRYSAGFARINYMYNNEFLFNLTGRRDGSSNFGPGLQFGNFGSVGAGWIFSEEEFLKRSIPALSFGKLSGSYGTTGSDGIKAYQYQALYAAFPNYMPTFQGIGATFPSNLYNPVYSWALKKSLNLALDLGFFNNRLLVNATYYRDRESNQLVNYPLPIQSGLGSVLGNLDATVQNKGMEFSLVSTNIQSKNFSWRTNFNVSFNRNKLLSFPNLASSSYASVYQIGQPTSIVYGFRYKDVNPTTGLFEFYNQSGGVTSIPKYGPVSTGGDQVPIGNREVKYQGGFGNTFTYKQLTLYVFCQFSSQNAQNYLAEAYSRQLGFMYNVPTAVLGNYWKAPGEVAQLQRLAANYGSPFFPDANNSAIGTALSFAQSSGVYGDDTYLRVKTVSLSYQLPDAWLRKIAVKKAGVFVNAQNLFTFTNYKVGDPETPGLYSNLPVQRIVALGLNFNF